MIRHVAMDTGHGLRMWSSSRGVCDGLSPDLVEAKETENPAAGLYYMLNKPMVGVTILLDMVKHLDEPRVLRLLRDFIEKQRSIRGHVILIDPSEDLPDVIAHDATRFEIALPEEAELTELIRRVVQRENREQRIEARLTRGALTTIVRNLRGLSRRQAEQIIIDAICENQRLDDGDINTVLARKRQLLHRDGLLEYVEAPTDLDDIAGLKRLKRWLHHRNAALDEKSQRFGLVPPRGVLMLGVPGAGKSLCAKAVATAWQRPLLRLDPSVLYDRFIGESEKRLRSALHQAEAMSPLILWIDEIEKGFASAGARSSDGGLSQRMFGTLLTWMQEHRAPVFLFATANNIEALPAELLRKGRFDEIFFVDLPSETVRRAIFKIHLAKRRHAPEGFDLDKLAEVSDGRTGAEIEQAIIAALHQSFADEKTLTTDAVVDALAESPPLAVTMGEHLHELRSWAKDRCVPAD